MWELLCTYGLAGPSAEDTETEFAINIEVGMNAQAMVLDELDLWGYYGIAGRYLKLELEQLVAVNRVVGGGKIDEEAEQVVVLEEAGVCGNSQHGNGKAGGHTAYSL